MMLINFQDRLYIVEYSDIVEPRLYKLSIIQTELEGQFV